MTRFSRDRRRQEPLSQVRWWSRPPKAVTALFGVLLVASMSSAVTPVTAGAEPTVAPRSPVEPAATWLNLGWSADPERAGALSGGADAWGTVEVDWQASADAVSGDSFTLGLPSRIRGDDRDPLEVQLATDDGYLGATGIWSPERDELTVELEQDGLPDGEDSTELLGGTLSFDVVWSEAAATSTSSGVRDLRFTGPGFEGADNKKAATLQAQYVAPEPEAATETSSASTVPKTPATPSVAETTTESPDAGTSADTDSTETSDTEREPRPTGLVARGSASATADGESDSTESLPSRDRPVAEVDPESEESEQLNGALGMFSTLAAAAVPTPGVNMPIASSTGATPWDQVTPDPEPNPGFPEACGMDATVVIDTSGSMSNADIQNAKAAASLLADVLEGTKSTVRIVPFAAASPSGGNASVSLARMSVNTQQAAIQSNIDKVRGTGIFGGDGTFYHRAFDQVLNDPGNVVMFLTDGGHRTASPNYDFLNNTQRNRFTEWIVPANAVKAGGARIIPVGVGNDFETSKPSSQRKAWAPPFWWMARGEDNLSVLDRDYYAVASTDALGTILSDAATQGCVGSLNLTSKERLRNGSEVNLGGFSYGVTGSGFQTTPAGTVTTDSGGGASIKITNGNGTATVTQSPRSPYNIRSVKCENNLTGANIPVTRSGNSFTLPLSDLSFVSCTVVNDKPVVNGAIEWTKVDSSTGELLGGSQWRLLSFPGGSPTNVPVNDCIADDASECVGLDTDPAAGKFFIDDLPPDYYYLTETQAPDDYQLDSTEHEVSLAEGEVHNFGPFANKSVFGALAFTKVDSVTDEVLPGSVWSMTPITGFGGTPTGPAVRVEDCVANDTSECTGPDIDPRGGEFYIDNIRKGEYRVQEVEAPFGYVQQEAPFDITFEGGVVSGQVNGVTMLRLQNTKQPVGTLAFSKVDADDETVLLPDSEWELFRVNGQGEPFGEAISLQDCIADDDADCTGLDKDSRAGEFLVELPYGNYVMEETVAPVGYTPLGVKAPITISSVPEGGPVLNEKSDGSIVSWSKVDEADPTSLLAGSEWELTPVDASGTPTGPTATIEDCVAATAAGCTGFDKDRRAGQFRVDVPYGNYELVESVAPVGYELDRTVHQIDATEGANAALGPIENGPEIPRGDLFFSKVDADDNDLLLAGSEWELTELDSMGAPAGPVLRIEDCVETSAAECMGLDRDPREGEFLLTGLPQGEYSLMEVVAPVGYDLPREAGVFLIGDEPTGGLIENEKPLIPNVLTWTKVSASDTADLLAGSEWELTMLDAAGDPDGPALVIEDCVAASAAECGGQDKDPRAGGFSVSGLTLTEYSLVETKAPAGYVLDDSPHVQLVSGETTMGPIENVQQDGLVIPFTGGLGAEKFLWGGAALAALVALMLALRHRVQRAALIRGDQG